MLISCEKGVTPVTRAGTRLINVRERKGKPEGLAIIRGAANLIWEDDTGVEGEKKNQGKGGVGGGGGGGGGLVGWGGGWGGVGGFLSTVGF